MGDQHTAHLTEARLTHLQIQANIIEGDAGTTDKLRRIKGQGEQRRHRCNHPMAELRRQSPTTGMTTRGQKNAVGLNQLPAAAFRLEAIDPILLQRMPMALTDVIADVTKAPVLSTTP